MTRREVAALCCRLMALIFLAWSVMYFVSAISGLGAAIAISHQFGGSEAYAVVKTAASLGCCLLLIVMALGWKAEKISRWMASDDPTPVTGPELSSEALMPVACVGVGLFAISQALPTFFRFASLCLFTETSVGEIWEDDEWKASLASNAMLMAWGLWLALGTRGMIRIVKWARSAGLDRQRQVSPSPPE